MFLIPCCRFEMGKTDAMKKRKKCRRRTTSKWLIVEVLYLDLEDLKQSDSDESWGGVGGGGGGRERENSNSKTCVRSIWT